MDYLYSWFSEPLTTIARGWTGVPPWVMIGLALLMFAGWTATYVEVIRKSFRDHAYGIPFPNTCLNFSWELIFSFDLMGGLPSFFFPLRYGHLFWLIPNSFNVYQTWKYGPSVQNGEWVKTHFRKLFLLTFVLSFTLIYTYHQYAHDVFGVASSWMINVFMSWLFIRMLLQRRNDVMADGTIRGMSERAAWFKLIGNGAGVVFCFYWWPAQFDHGLLRHAGWVIPEPQSYTFLYVVYISNLLLDAALIRLIRVREREIREGRPATKMELSAI